MSEKWLVLKFGGSSVRGLDQWRAIAERVAERRAEGYSVLLVCSAIEGITDLLESIARQPAEADAIEQFASRHRNFAAELGVDGEAWINKACERIMRSCAALQSAESPRIVAEISAQGEWLLTRLAWAWLQREQEVEWIDVRGLLRARFDTERSERRQWLSADCVPGADPAMKKGLDGCWPVVITQGYVAGLPAGGTALLGRGGSDTSAALLGGRIGAERVEIWTDVPGMFSADPRIIPEARLLRILEYPEALEMAASGAGVVHSNAIRAAEATATPLWIKDTGRPDLEGTRIEGVSITGVLAGEEGARAVVCQQNMAVLLLENIDPRRQVGFLASVFKIIAGHGISIDLVATSETTTTVAINRATNHLDDDDLEHLVDDLRERCTVVLHGDCVTVNIVGRGVRRSLAQLQGAFVHFDASPLLMVSQSANDLCLSLLVKAGDQHALLQSAHQALIPGRERTSDFGPSWLELQEGAGAKPAVGGQA